MKTKILLFTALLSAPLLANSGDYTIVKDDNLWNLSGEYLGDPMQWQRIWNENQYIDNPDLIYPGNTLNIPGIYKNDKKELQVKQDAPVTFQDRVAGLVRSDSEKSTANPADSSAAPARTALEAYFSDRSDLYSVSTLRSAPYVLSDDKNAESDLKLIPGMGRINDDSRQMYGLNTIVTVVADSGESFVKGELYDLSVSVKYMSHNDRNINVIRPVGAGIVKSVDGNIARLRIVDAWAKIENGARVEPYRSFKKLKEPSIKRDVVPAHAKLLTRIEKDILIKPYEVLILDSGLDTEIVAGDLFEAFSADQSGKVDYETSFRGIAITVDENTSALIVQEVYKRTSDGDFKLKRYGRLIFK